MIGKNKAKTAIFRLSVGFLAIALSCSDTDPGTGPDDIDDIGHFDFWDEENDPIYMQRNLEYDWDVLSEEDLERGESAHVPWPGYAWPGRSDGFNERWQGRNHLSPVELYDMAFNNWRPPEGYTDLRRFTEPGRSYDEEYYERMGPAAQWAHEEGGNYAARLVTAPDGTELWDSSDGEDAEWGGIHRWYGHCHTWAAAAISVEEPLGPATINDVTFEVSDIKALIAASFEETPRILVGERCNTSNVRYDEHGRIIEKECRDINAGAFHILLVNIVGIDERTFIMDGTAGVEIWNQAVRAYRIRSQEEVDMERALELIGRRDSDIYPYNSFADRYVHVRSTVQYVSGGSPSTEPYLDRVDERTNSHDLEYLLELDADGYIVGGEWLNDSWYPDFIWLPEAGVSNRGIPNILNYSNVQRLIELSLEQ